jgi:photosystem II stability/assembly factor-like uncharacterized protein
MIGGEHLFRSTDRGDTWQERTLPSLVINADVAFMNDTNGLLLSAGSAATQCQAQLAVIWRTTDGAASWQKLPGTGIADGMCKRGITSSDAAHAFFTAWSPNVAPVIYRTSDGGQTWQASSPLPDPPGVTSRGAGFELIPGRPRGFGSLVLLDAVFGPEQTRYVFRSTDGGATWHGYTTDYSQAAPVGPDIVFGDGMVGYATVRGAIQRTTDGGTHWTGIKTPGTG